MSKNDISKLTFSNLLELKSAVSDIKEKYAENLTNYGIMNNDVFLSEIGVNEKIMLEKHKLFSDFLNKINTTIEERIIDEYL